MQIFPEPADFAASGVNPAQSTIVSRKRLFLGYSHLIRVESPRARHIFYPDPFLPGRTLVGFRSQSLPDFAGSFIYVSAVDLIPELQHYSSPLVVVSMILGFLVIVAFSLFLPLV